MSRDRSLSIGSIAVIREFARSFRLLHRSIPLLALAELETRLESRELRDLPAMRTGPVAGGRLRLVQVVDRRLRRAATCRQSWPGAAIGAHPAHPGRRPPSLRFLAETRCLRKNRSISREAFGPAGSV